MSDYRIATVERFAEPGFTQLAASIFPDLGPRVTVPEATRLRIGAFADEQLVGWAHGWFIDDGSYYMANSAVVPAHRRHGLYSALVRRTIEIADQRGAPVVRSRHVATNNAVLIAKLKLGFVVTGTEVSETLGLLVCLAYWPRNA